MPRVAPTEYNEDGEDAPVPHHHTPNARHFTEVADGSDRQVLVDFEKYTIRSSDEEDHHPNANIKTNKRFTEGERLTGDPGRAPQTQQTSKPIATDITIIVTPGTRNAGKFIQCDTLTGIIILAYLLCVLITTVTIVCYQQDTMWNGIVHSELAFPEIEEEYFFRGKHLFIPEHEGGLRHAKHNLLRENRWFELMHLMVMCAFLILTFFQILAYITRGNADHSSLVVGYYTVFAGVGLIVALFPLLSWHNQEENYKVAAHYLMDFSRRQWILPKDQWVPGLTNATAHDAYTLGKIMKFCYDASQDGLALDTDSKQIPLFRRQYNMEQLQLLGFCTYHRLKILNTIMSTFFGLFCCIIPCMICFNASNKKREEVQEKRVIETRQYQYPQQREQQPPPVEEQYRPRSGSRERRRSVEKERGFDQGDLSQKQINEVDKWRRHLEQDSN